MESTESNGWKRPDYIKRRMLIIRRDGRRIWMDTAIDVPIYEGWAQREGITEPPERGANLFWHWYRDRSQHGIYYLQYWDSSPGGLAHIQPLTDEQAEDFIDLRINELRGCEMDIAIDMLLLDPNRML